MIRRMSKALAVVALLAATGQQALGCQVCYGAADAPIIDGMNMSIVFMLGTVYLTICGMVATFLIARRRGNGSAEGERV